MKGTIRRSGYSSGPDFLHECGPRRDMTTVVAHSCNGTGWYLDDGEYTHLVAFCPYCGDQLPEPSE